ncbi:MAG: TatD family deoxyribonuclease [Betaproteobacteria bacterium]|jgi:TatD DNase family protein|nr:TatD family deoxyribonuclease [Betaproteobacteria bacterium]
MPWIDTHCHLDAAEFDADRDLVRQNAKSLGVETCVIPAVMASHFDEVRLLAHRHADAYALGIHPLYTPQAEDKDLASLDTHLHAHRDDPRLVALGEIGLDGFVPEINTPEAFAKQTHFFEAQLQIAQRHQLPVILHVRRSADGLLKGLRQFPVTGGIAHAFNGSLQQAKLFIEMGFKLGFGGAMTYDRATKLRALATELPLSALVLETDAPDIPPRWIYTTAEDREKGMAQGRNSPAELPRIASVLAELRGISLEELSAATSANARQALPRLQSTV